jgi:hypothetical protein
MGWHRLFFGLRQKAMAKSTVKMQVLAPSEIKAEAEGSFMEFLREGAVSSELPLETSPASGLPSFLTLA